MTTHVFIVDDNTFKYHLEYMFAGTGANAKKIGKVKQEYVIDFNNSSETILYEREKQAAEKMLVGMMADGCRVRKDDLIIFYLVEKQNVHEGMFFGVFQAAEDGIFLDNFDENQFLYEELKKSLTFRLKIKPDQVYKQGVTEWEALDEIKNICSPYQMLWSLIYRKLKGNRGNTMITTYESKKLISLIRQKNKNQTLNFCDYTFDGRNIIKGEKHKEYTGRTEEINILPRLLAKATRKQAFEVYLQMYITQNIGRGINESLDKALNAEKNIEWIGNEVSCGVGLQRIDVMISKTINENQKIVMPIELKAVTASFDNTRQLGRYIEWIKQYYVPNSPESDIQPVLICVKRKKLSDDLKNEFKRFNQESNVFPLKYIEYEILENNLFFKIVDYQK